MFDDGKEKQTKLHGGVEMKTRQTSIAHFMFDLESKQASRRTEKTETILIIGLFAQEAFEVSSFIH